MAARIEILQPRATRLRAAPAPLTFALLLAVCIALWPGVAALARIWGAMADYEHGVLIVGVAVIWLALLRQRLDQVVVRPRPLALAALAVAVVLWAVAARANSELLQQALTPPIMLLAVLALLGERACAIVAPPVAYLYFAIPVWESLVPLLQAVTTQVAEILLGVLGVPTIVQGNEVAIPAGRFTIAEGCSGKRYLIIALAFAASLGAWRRLDARRTTILLALTTVLALVTNWLRVVVIIFVGQISDMQHYLVATEHVSFGYVLFAPLLAAVALIGRRLDPGRVDDLARQTDSSSTRGVAPVGVMALAILAAPAAHSWMRTQAGILRPALGAMPVLTNEWQGPLPANERWRPEFIGPSAERRAAYSSAAGRVEVYVNVYGEQEQGRELVFYRNSTTPSEQWSQIGSLPETAATLRAKLVVHASQQQWIVAETYHVGGWSTPSAALAQISYGALSLRRPAPAGLIAIAAPCAPDCDSARALLVSFWGAEGERLTGLIPAVMDPDARSAQ